MKRLLQVVGLISWCAQVHGQVNQDPLTNFCRRFSQQTAVIDNKLFIDGGYVDYGGQINAFSVNYTNTYLLWADLSTVNDLKFPPLYNNLSKPTTVPSLAGGTLWADDVNKVFFLYGGEYNTTTQVPQSYASWLYDAAYGLWNNTKGGPDGIVTPAYGAGTTDPERGTGYYYGGWRTNQTAWNVEGRTLSSDLIVFDFESQTFNSPTSFYDSTPRGEGGLYYIPASDAGMLIYFGGIEQTASNGSGAYIGSAKYAGAPMDTIYIYDIAGQKPYLQKTSGTPPPMRRRFCGGVSWPDDRSSYNIYIFGGMEPYEDQGIGFGDAWILSIPSFTWTAYYNVTPSYPHHSSSCNVIKEGQMIVMGGWFPNSSFSDCDVRTIGGMHNLDLGSANVLGAPWYQFLPNVTTYTLPPNLTSVIGGSSNGGSTRESPLAGWGSPDLSSLLQRKVATSTRTATRVLPPTAAVTQPPPPGKGTNVGAIAGGVVGGVIGLALLLLGVYICLRRHKSSKQQSPTQHSPVAQIAEAPGHEYQNPYGSPQLKHQRTTSAASTSFIGSPELPVQQHFYSPVTSPRPQWQQPAAMNSQHSHFTEDLPPQQYYPPPQQAQPFYPPPPAPQTYELLPQTAEMPSVRSPANVAESKWRAAGGDSRGRGQGAIDEE